MNEDKENADELAKAFYMLSIENYINKEHSDEEKDELEELTKKFYIMLHGCIKEANEEFDAANLGAELDWSIYSNEGDVCIKAYINKVEVSQEKIFISCKEDRYYEALARSFENISVEISKLKERVFLIQKLYQNGDLQKIVFVNELKKSNIKTNNEKKKIKI